MQANKIIELRPFTSVEDLNTKLGQGKKKAGPAGISPRMFADSAALFEGYGRVDSILADCEGIGADLKKEIASWTHGSKSAKGKQRELAENSRDSSVSAEDGAVMLTHVALPAHKPKYYMTSQPSLLKAWCLRVVARSSLDFFAALHPVIVLLPHIIHRASGYDVAGLYVL